MILEPTESNVARCAEAILAGHLIGMPTETVYGIAADATNVAAVRATFAAKGRPSENPLIVHIADASLVLDVASEFPDAARALARTFWPGPLTLVLPKLPSIPDEVTAGLGTVAVRVPSHPVARRLLEVVGRPVSAPSANVFTALSPTRAVDISPAIAGRLDAILDGGPCQFGIESTVVECTAARAVVLRLGAASVAALELALGATVDSHAPTHADATHKAPGQYARHYSPRTRVELVDRLLADDVGLTFEAPATDRQVWMSSDPVAYGTQLYAALHRLDALGAASIRVARPPDFPAWAAVMDRLTRASSS